MKKIRIITGLTIAVIIGGAIVINSCTKHENESEIDFKDQTVELSEENQAFINRLVDFKEKIECLKQNPGYKNGEKIDATEAVKSMEDLFNVSHGFPDEHYGNTKTDAVTVQIAVDNNHEVLMDDVVVKYDEIKNIVTQFYYNSGFTEKGFLLLDLEKREIANNQLEISIRSVTGEKDEGWEPFGPDDNWWFGYQKGDCELNGDGDAAIKIQEALMNHKPLYYPPPGYRFGYSDYEQIPLFGHEYKDENGEYLIFYIENAAGNFTWEDKCLHLVGNENELNFHFNGEETVIYWLLPNDLNKPENWTFMECLIEGKEELNPHVNDIPCIHHNNDLTYALRYLIPIGIIEPPVEL
ncbi:MAG: hypothetical protein H8D45_15700 [Bacteroidetes bacterium]|nr:hypothetical protein [Bacteroidota bacterium]MBL7105315.1 hypothetical protein [Bacteroidales bacterium]